MPIILLNFLRFTVSIGLMALFLSILLSSINSEFEMAFTFGHAILLLIGVVLIMFRKLRSEAPLTMKKNTAALVIFISYAFINFLYDSDAPSVVWSAFLGSTGGMIYGLLLGIIVSMSTKYLIMETHFKLFYLLQKLTVILIFIYIAIDLDRIYTREMSFLRLDIFLTSTKDVSYQKIGASLVLIILAMGLLMLNLKSLFFDKYITILLASLFLFAAYKAIIIGQIIGSNSASVSVFVLSLVIIILALANTRELRSFANLKKILPRLVLYLAIMVIFCLFFAFTFFETHGDIDYSKMRLFGFGSNESSSFTSRWEILNNNFLTHFLYNPIVGNAQVDVKTTGIGTYVHSIPLSALTHLGVVGFIIFLVLNHRIISAPLPNRLRRGEGKNNRLSDKHLYSTILFVVVLMLGTFSTFFTWLPYWFMVGYILEMKNNGEN